MHENLTKIAGLGMIWQVFAKYIFPFYIILSLAKCCTNLVHFIEVSCLLPRSPQIVFR